MAEYLWWSRLRCYAWSLAPAWPSVLIAAVFGLVLFYPDQVQDLALGADLDWHSYVGRALALAGWNIALGLTLWFAARFLMARDRPLPNGIDAELFTPAAVHDMTEPLVLWLARVVGIAVPLLAAAAFAYSASHARGQDPVSLAPIVDQSAAAIVIFAFVVKRRALSAAVAGSSPTLQAALTPHRPVGACPDPRGESVLALTLCAIWACLAGYFTIWSFWPVSMGHSLGPFAVLSIGLIGLCIGLSVFAFAQRKWHAPVFAALAFLIILAGYTADNHTLHRLLGVTPKAMTLDEAYEAFIERAPPSGKKRLLLVATAGGGIRAAYWTAYALGQFRDAHPAAFDDAFFAISGVSGGGVGSVFYRAMLKTQEHKLPACIPRLRGGDKPGTPTNLFAICADHELGQDGIGPTLVGALFPDLLQRFLPLLPILPDRAQALERAWSGEWNVDADAAAKDYLAQPFANLWSMGPFPILLLNGTSVAAGHRILTSNLDLSADRSSVFTDIQPFPNDYVISAATAALNTARFPIVSPPGTIPESSTLAADQIIDGGVFENSGAETTRELLDWLMNAKTHQRLDIFVLQITSDPEQSDDDPAKSCVRMEGAATPPAAPRFLPDISSAAVGLYRSRGARGVGAMQALRKDVQRIQALRPEGEGVSAPNLPPQVNYASIRLEDIDNRPNAPLGWTLSGAAIQAIKASWPVLNSAAPGGPPRSSSNSNSCNARDVQALMNWLARS